MTWRGRRRDRLARTQKLSQAKRSQSFSPSDASRTKPRPTGRWRRAPAVDLSARRCCANRPILSHIRGRANKLSRSCMQVPLCSASLSRSWPASHVACKSFIHPPHHLQAIFISPPPNRLTKVHPPCKPCLRFALYSWDGGKASSNHSSRVPRSIPNPPVRPAEPGQAWIHGKAKLHRTLKSYLHKLLQRLQQQQHNYPKPTSPLSSGEVTGTMDSCPSYQPCPSTLTEHS